MKITKIDDEYYVFRTGVKLTMTVRKYLSGKLERSDTGFLGDKSVPKDIAKKIGNSTL